MKNKCAYSQRAWWQVNCSPVVYDWDAARSMAVSNCSNSGLNLLTAYYDGSDIIYKESPNAMVFKTTGVGNAGKAAISMYPNPVTDKLHVAGAVNAAYEVDDVTGKSLMSGRLPADGTVEVPDIPCGLYLLSVSREDTTVQRFKFTKE